MSLERAITDYRTMAELLRQWAADKSIVWREISGPPEARNPHCYQGFHNAVIVTVVSCEEDTGTRYEGMSVTPAGFVCRLEQDLVKLLYDNAQANCTRIKQEVIDGKLPDTGMK